MSFPLPDHVEKYAESPIFTNETVPAKLTSAHSTKANVWGRIRVLTGVLEYTLTGPPERSVTVKAGESHIIEPEVLHMVTLQEHTSFQIDFLK